eukprot:6514083-Prymnesium_polylepis.1
MREYRLGVQLPVSAPEYWQLRQLDIWEKFCGDLDGQDCYTDSSERVEESDAASAGAKVTKVMRFVHRVNPLPQIMRKVRATPLCHPSGLYWDSAVPHGSAAPPA